MARAVIPMAFGCKKEDIEPKKLCLSMYMPQAILLLIAFVLGIYMPENLANLLFEAVSELI